MNMNMHDGDVNLMVAGTVILSFGICLVSWGKAGFWLLDVCVLLSLPLFVMALMGFFGQRAFNKSMDEADRQQNAKPKFKRVK